MMLMSDTVSKFRFCCGFFIDPYIPKDDTMDTLSSPTVTIDESQYRSKGNISKRLKNRFLRVSIKVNPSQRDPTFEFKEKKGELKEHRKQIMNLKSTFEKYWNTLAELRSLTKSIDETILAILKPSLDHGVLTSIADEKPPLSRLKDLKKPHLSSSLRGVEDVLKIISKAEVAQLSENRAGNAGDKAQEAKEEAKKINDELRHKIPQTEKFVQSSITEFASEYLNFVDEEVEVEKKCRSVMRNWLFPKSSKPTAETNCLQRCTPHRCFSIHNRTPTPSRWGSGEYANSDTVKNPVAPTKSSLSSIARSQPSVDYDQPSKPSQNGTAESQKKTHIAKAAAEKPIPSTSLIAKLAEDSEDEEEEKDDNSIEEKGKEEEEDDEDASELSFSASDNSDSEDTGSEEVSEENEDNENSTKDHEADDLCSLPAPFKVVALYPYKAQEDDELDMTQNDVIKVIDRGDDVEKEPGWLYGKNKRTGKFGLFPTNHVKKLD
nr:unnamed protein product [Spirometra erinaceieuropaei]